MQPSSKHRRTPFPRKKWRAYADAHEKEVSRPLREILKRCDSRADHVMHRSQVSGATWDSAEWGSEYEGDFSTGKAHWLRRLVALFVLLPVSLVVMMSLYQQVVVASNKIDILLSTPVWYTLLGCLAWLVLAGSRLFTKAFVFFYVLGHELTHVLAIVVSFGRVSGFKVTLDGGHVQTNKNNIFIALSPYFIPLWVLVWAGVYALVNWFYPLSQFQGILYGGIGFWWAFHLFWTVWIIPRDQPDLRENDTFFSVMIVYLANMLLIGAMLVLCEAVNVKAFGVACITNSQNLWEMLKDFVALLV